jgi:hypothetical protein
MEVPFDIQPEPFAERIAVRAHRTALAYSRELPSATTRRYRLTLPCYLIVHSR